MRDYNRLFRHARRRIDREAAASGPELLYDEADTIIVILAEFLRELPPDRIAAGDTVRMFEALALAQNIRDRLISNGIG